MVLLDWWLNQRRQMEFICNRAAELRAQHGDDAESWCDVRLAGARQPIERRTMKQLRKALKHLR